MRVVRLSEIFCVVYGTNLELNKMNEVGSSRGIPFVSRTSTNNGVSAYVEQISGINPNKAHTLSVAGGGSVLETFYQDQPYYSGRDLYVLTPRSDLGKDMMLAYAALIRANKYRYSYGRQANKTLEKIKIPHPDEVKKLVSRVKIPKEPTSAPYHNQSISLHNREWRLFLYSEIFTLLKGKRLTKADMKVGETPFIGAIDNNNGLSHMIGRGPIFQENTITVNYNGSVGFAFYQPKDYWASDDCNILKNDRMNPYVGQFLCTLIEVEKYRFNYGRKWRIGRMEDSQIKLPVTEQGNPDWQFMEDYIKSLPYSSNLANPTS